MLAGMIVVVEPLSKPIGILFTVGQQDKRFSVSLSESVLLLCPFPEMITDATPMQLRGPQSTFRQVAAHMGSDTSHRAPLGMANLGPHTDLPVNPFGA